jgi:DNA-binding LacI/PurR family transcriptional regulator
MPEELSLVGYDDIEIADVMQLTTVRQLLFESGKRGAELLLQVLEDAETEPVHLELPTTLVQRATTAPPKTDTK